MSRERFERAREVFTGALELDQEERAAFLGQACGDDAELRVEVDDLLRFHAADSSTLPPVNSLCELPEDEMPQRIGSYRLLRRLGSGGMGDVYEAEQEQPVRRRVALKLIKWGMDTREVVARFESERQALALMAHPNIARVFDAGATAQGRPYFVMELVKGHPLTEYCDRQRSSTEERLRLIIEVCSGVQHAHHKGIIHRDLKPSNLLVTMIDGRPVTKIIDFGVAKATSQRLTERTVFTELGQWIGTPEYMSPEQAELTAIDVDTRTDVYSLGAVLYELLVGAQLFDAQELRSSGFDAMRRLIREQEPKRPSTRISKMGEDLISAADKRRTDPKRLLRSLRGDLDWITMKALEKDRTRRYGSPAELAADLERHLRHQAVLAGPPSTLYRMRKLVRRNRAAVVTATLALLVLVTGLVATTMALVRVRRAERLANTQVELLIGLFDALDPGGETGRTASAEQILATAAARIDSELVDQPLVRSRIERTMARIYASLGDHNQARALFESALGLRQQSLDPMHPEVSESLRDLGAHLGVIGEYRLARERIEQALAIDEKLLGPDHPTTADSLQTLGLVLWRDGKLMEAREVLARALAIQETHLAPDHPTRVQTLYTYALVLRDLDDLTGARSALEQVLAVREKTLGPAHTNVAWTLSNLGRVLAMLGETELAQQHLERALEIQTSTFGPDHMSVIEPSLFLGDLLLAGDDINGARQMIQRAFAAHERIFGSDHHFLGYSLDALGRVAEHEGNLELACGYFERSMKLREDSLGHNHPQVAWSLGYLGRVAMALGEHERAVSLFERRLGILEKSYEPDDPRVTRADDDLVRARRHLLDS
jgi:serine/threonine protein kinase/Tfp pilus assembly protein PilF